MFSANSYKTLLGLTLPGKILDVRTESGLGQGLWLCFHPICWTEASGAGSHSFLFQKPMHSRCCWTYSLVMTGLSGEDRGGEPHVWKTNVLKHVDGICVDDLKSKQPPRTNDLNSSSGTGFLFVLAKDLKCPYSIFLLMIWKLLLVEFSMSKLTFGNKRFTTSGLKKNLQAWQKSVFYQ